MAKKKQKSTQKALFNDARNDLLSPASEKTTNGEYVDAKLNALGRMVWLKKHKTEPPQRVIPTGDEFFKWYRNLSQEARQPHIDAGKKFYKKVVGIDFIEYGKDVLADDKKAERENALIVLWILGLRNPDFLTKFLIGVVHDAWFALDENDRGKHPFSSIIKAWQDKPRTVRESSVSIVHDKKGEAIGSIMPFEVSEFSRNTFSEIPIETATVDGVPILTQITDAEESIRHALKERTRRLLISGQGGEVSLEFPSERQPPKNSFFGLLYGEFERRFGTVMARNMGYLAKIIYSANQPIEVSEYDGGQLFARHLDGRYRTPKKSDIARFNDAALALRNFVFFTNMETRSWRTLASIEPDKNGVYTLDKALWFDRDNYTLTGGLVFALKRNSRQNSHLPRIIEGVEYYLARAWRPKNKISELLLPAQGNTGPGQWVEIGWREFLALIGENMTKGDATLSRIFRRHKDVLESEGYIYRAGSEAQDTVEFRIGHGTISFRATEKGVEAAKQARKQDWETKSLNEVLGNPFDYRQK